MKFDGGRAIETPFGNYNPTDSRIGAGNWLDFIDGAPKARKIQVYINDKLVATFTPTTKSVRSVASQIAAYEPVGSRDIDQYL
ncbi:hypothetical protein [Moraxella caviae]|nr:hypothetical protein [Moraxella caviae]